MRQALAVDCPACEPDPVLLEQLTALAAASTVPASKPWWQRFTVKTGAAAVAGALLVSGATADAEHAKPAPIAAPIVRAPIANHALPPRKPTPVAVPQTSFVVLSSSLVPMRHAGKRAHRRHLHAHIKKRQDGSGDRGGSGNSSGDVRLARVVTVQTVSAAMQAAPAGSRPHGHSRQRTNSRH